MHLGGCNLLTIDVEIRIIRSMGDAGEGLVDAESRLAERMDEREEEKKKARQVEFRERARR